MTPLRLSLIKDMYLDETQQHSVGIGTSKQLQSL
jgi:hypothetical protein